MNNNIANKLIEIAQKQQKIYQAGVELGKNAGGYTQGVIDGKQAQYDMFWDIYQDNGNRSDYGLAFARRWKDEIFNPKYDFIITNAGAMFQDSDITILASKLKEKGLKFDTSKSTGALQMFQGAKIKDVPELDLRNCTNIGYIFGSSAKVETIEKLILSEKATTNPTTWFSAKQLTHCLFEGVLAVTGVSLKESTLLDKESIVSLVNILSNETSGLSVTLSKASVDIAFGESNLFQIMPNTDTTGSNVTTTKYTSKTTSGIVCGMAQIEGGKTYVIRRNVWGKAWRYFFYDTYPLDTSAISINGAYLASNLNNITITAPENAKYLVIRGSEGLTEEEMQKFELIVCEEGSNSTEWQNLVNTKSNWTINLT